MDILKVIWLFKNYKKDIYDKYKFACLHRVSIDKAYFIGYIQAYILSSSTLTGVHHSVLVIVSELEGSCVLVLVNRNFAETNITFLDLCD